MQKASIHSSSVDMTSSLMTAVLTSSLDATVLPEEIVMISSFFSTIDVDVDGILGKSELDAAEEGKLDISSVVVDGFGSLRINWHNVFCLFSLHNEQH